jgi:hypothetical protein
VQYQDGSSRLLKNCHFALYEETQIAYNPPE